LSNNKIILEVDSYLVKVLAITTGLSEKRVLYRFNDEARKLASHIMKDSFNSNWSSKMFTFDKSPLKIKVKAKYDGYQGKKIWNVICTFNVDKGRIVRYDTEDLFNEMVESTLLEGE
jgi:hypothetical protein